jgi:ABC-type glycerol-3-phosphate transport system permease component
MISTSFRNPEEIVTNPPHFFPKVFTIRSYVHVIFGTEIPRYFFNSLIVSALATVICLVFSILAGFALSWFRFKLKNIFGIVILCCQMVPSVALLLPLFLMMEKINLTNNLLGLSIVYQILVIPFCTWMLRGFFSAIPREIDEAARIDGCSPIMSLCRIVIPMSGTGIFVAGMFSWMASWEEFLFALTLTRDKYARTVPIGIEFFMGEHFIDWGPIMASCFLLGIPVVIFFFFFQNKYIQGIAGGAIKG